MISAIYWNIRGVRSKKAIHRLKHLVNINKVTFVAISEPLVDMNKIEGYRKFLGFQYCIANTNGKIWCFWSHLDNAMVLTNDEQQITITFQNTLNNFNLSFTAVYAKGTPLERKDLWESLEDTSILIKGPWCIAGDFNVIMDPDEKLGGRPHRAWIS